MANTERQSDTPRNQPNSDRNRSRQAEQWQADSPGQTGGWQDDTAQRDGYHRYDRGESQDYRSNERSGYTSGRGQSREEPLYDRHEYRGDYGQDFGSFRGDDFGGRDFQAPRSGAMSGGFASSESYRPTYGASRWFGSDYDRQDRSSRSGRDYDEWRRYGEDRGFMERAGDEIASWFGDKDAARRREMDHADDHRGRGPSGYTRSDERIREDANDALTHERRLDATHIAVSVDKGEVTLDGTVNSRACKRAAEDAVHDLSGVKHVQNNLRVKDERSAQALETNPQNRSGTTF
jgi:osmotically-inducible protein OsmY